MNMSMLVDQIEQISMLVHDVLLVVGITEETGRTFSVHGLLAPTIAAIVSVRLAVGMNLGVRIREHPRICVFTVFILGIAIFIFPTIFMNSKFSEARQLWSVIGVPIANVSLSWPSSEAIDKFLNVKNKATAKVYVFLFMFAFLTLGQFYVMKTEFINWYTYIYPVGILIGFFMPSPSGGSG